MHIVSSKQIFLKFVSIFYLVLYEYAGVAELLPGPLRLHDPQEDVSLQRGDACHYGTGIGPRLLWNRYRVKVIMEQA